MEGEAAEERAEDAGEEVTDTNPTDDFFGAVIAVVDEDSLVSDVRQRPW